MKKFLLITAIIAALITFGPNTGDLAGGDPPTGGFDSVKVG